MTRPRIVNHASEIAIYTAGVLKANDDYREHPFAATRVTPCKGTCRGYVVVPFSAKPDLCHACANTQERATT
jgi:hypothetical protein